MYELIDEDEADTHWVLNTEDKEAMKRRIIPSMGVVPSKEVLMQLEDALFFMFITELPSDWNSCFEEIVALIKSGAELPVYAGLCALKSFVRKFEFELKVNREPMDKMVALLFGDLENMLKELLGS